ncbi:hypothetical protein [Mucilaginibacter pineti]|uniref:hypothetical protein n=1 Tax=Mucilaginibacter pineti TaxID=1391627 RepID=UPI0019675BD2|nr:hypothetical protein [Mucilaginibacter pineti]
MTNFKFNISTKVLLQTSFITKDQQPYTTSNKGIIRRLINDVAKIPQLADTFMVGYDTSDMRLAHNFSAGNRHGIYPAIRQPSLEQAHIYSKVPYINTLITSHDPEQLAKENIVIHGPCFR